MPYVVVETTDTLGNNELLAAPESWIQQGEDGKQYLCWPNVRNITTLNALLQNDCSVPSLMWEKHECMIIRHNILSLALASKAIEGIQRHSEKLTNPAKRVAPKSPDADENPKRNYAPGKNVRERYLTGQNKDYNYAQEVLYESKPDISSDPLEETRTSSNVFQMFNELKSLIDSNQEEMTKKMNEGFFRIQKTMVAMMHKRTGQPVPTSATGTLNATSQSFASTTFNMKVLKTLEEMNNFEEQLKDDDYRKQVRHWVDSVVSYERNPECRMMEILDLLFDRHLLPNFSWTGASTKGVKKHAFGEYKNIILLFAYVGTTSLHRADKKFVANFFMKKLRHASVRAVGLKGMRRCVPHTPAPRSIKNRMGVKNINTVASSSKYVKLSKVEYENAERIDDSDENNVEYTISTVEPQQAVVDHQYTGYKRLKIDAMNDLQPTLCMSAEDESE
ncbi:uncharacterized protein LOC128708518 [Anopheles marshallii]|uniref:uncharacterized protein LOC128708518 n=1 Tax=Anopheles marshallii TaxID=1521116 RepID=UPI00237B74EB|nr:uncharacterized protein LOC128708518 [Anopheles marshallii]